jgi:anti-sigma factor RsiW
MKHLTEDQLQEYLDQTLPFGVRRRAEAHLASCDTCAGRLEELKVVFAGLATLPERRLSRDLSAAVLPRLRQPGPRRWRPVFAAQNGAALGAFIWLAGEAATAIQRIELSALVFKLARFLTLPGLRLIPLDFQFSLPSLPFNDFGGAEISTFNLALLAVSAFVLWMAGNAALLRGRLNLKR